MKKIEIEMENRVFREINRDFSFRQNRTALHDLINESGPLDVCYLFVSHTTTVTASYSEYVVTENSFCTLTTNEDN